MDFIMESPPEITGDISEDIIALREHIAELQEELEYTFKRRLGNDSD